RTTLDRRQSTARTRRRLREIHRHLFGTCTRRREGGVPAVHALEQPETAAGAHTGQIYHLILVGLLLSKIAACTLGAAMSRINRVEVQEFAFELPDLGVDSG